MAVRIQASFSHQSCLSLEVCALVFIRAPTYFAKHLSVLNHSGQYPMPMQQPVPGYVQPVIAQPHSAGWNYFKVKTFSL